MHSAKRAEIIESAQRIVARALARHPAGEGLRLIGGFRYRLLDGSARRSMDLDYHWAGDLDEKVRKVVGLLDRKVRPEIQAQLNLDSRVTGAGRPADDSPFARTVELALFRIGSDAGRIEIPIDVTRIACIDKPIVRTVDGVVYLSASDADMVESKALALFLRPHLADRDLLDLFLFQQSVPPDSPKRLARKKRRLKVGNDLVAARLSRLTKNRAQHVKALDRIIAGQVDPTAAAHIKAVGGWAMVFEQVINLLTKRMGFGKGAKS